MLFGNIMVNEHHIGSWSAIAMRDHGPMAGTSCRYECEVVLNGKRADIFVEHAYDDGALVLMRKMLDAAIEAM